MYGVKDGGISEYIAQMDFYKRILNRKDPLTLLKKVTTPVPPRKHMEPQNSTETKDDYRKKRRQLYLYLTADAALISAVL